MKRYSLVGLLTVLVAVTVWAAIIEVPEAPARMTAVVAGGGSGSAPVGDSCTGTLLLSSHFENSNDVTVGGGCSAGADSTWALGGTTPPTYSDAQEQDGSYSVYQNNGGSATSNAVISVTSRDIISEAEGKITFYVRITANFHTESRTTLLQVLEVPDDFMTVTGIYTGSANVLRFQFSRDAVGAADVTTTDGLSLNTWHLVTIAWKINTNPGLSIKIDAGTPVTAALGNWAWNTTPVSVSVAIGSADADVMEVYFIDNLKIYSTSGL